MLQQATPANPPDINKSKGVGSAFYYKDVIAFLIYSYVEN